MLQIEGLFLSYNSSYSLHRQEEEKKTTLLISEFHNRVKETFHATEDGNAMRGFLRQTSRPKSSARSG